MLTGKGRLPLRSNWCSDIKSLYQPIIPNSTNILSNAIRSFALGRNLRTAIKWWNGTSWQYPPFLQKLPFNSSIEDEDYSGITFSATTDTGVEFGDVVYLDGSVYKKANAASIATAPAKAIAVDTNVVMRAGFIRSSLKFNFTPGASIWLSVGGGIANTQPSSTNNVVQSLGWASSIDCIYFEPDQTYLEML